jgi:hypothetical protein
VFCPACDQHLSGDANFCPRCGAPQARRGRTHPPRWETCRTTFEAVPTPYHRGSLASSAPVPYAEVWRFVAEALGPGGPYRAAVSDELSGDPSQQPDRVQALLRGLVDRLVRDGWEALPSSEGTTYRFRRRIGA